MNKRPFQIKIYFYQFFVQFFNIHLFLLPIFHLSAWASGLLFLSAVFFENTLLACIWGEAPISAYTILKADGCCWAACWFCCSFFNLAILNFLEFMWLSIGLDIPSIDSPVVFCSSIGVSVEPPPQYFKISYLSSSSPSSPGSCLLKKLKRIASSSNNISFKLFLWSSLIFFSLYKL